MTSATDPVDAAVDVSLAQLARRYPDLLPEEQVAVRRLVRMWAKDD